MHEETNRKVHQIDRAHGRVEEDLQNCLRLASEQERVQERVTSGAPAGTTMAVCKPATVQARSHARLDFAPRGALGGFAQPAAALVASAPTSSSGGSRLGVSGCSNAGRRSEAVGVEESVPVAVRVGRDGGDGGSHRGLGLPSGSDGRIPRGA